MARFVLRYRGKGAAPELDVETIEARLRVVDRMPRMLLVDGDARVIHEVTSHLNDWLVAEETTLPLPDARKRIRS